MEAPDYNTTTTGPGELARKSKDYFSSRQAQTKCFFFVLSLLCYVIYVHGEIKVLLLLQ